MFCGANDGSDHDTDKLDDYATVPSSDMKNMQEGERPKEMPSNDPQYGVKQSASSFKEEPNYSEQGFQDKDLSGRSSQNNP